MFPFYSYVLDVKKILPILILFASCAQPVVPTGGNKDETGPSISAVHISRGTSTQVTLTFDENVLAEQADQNILISPATSTRNVVKPIQHGLNITIDTILPEKFQIQFLTGAVRDLNEKNPMADTVLFFQGTKTLDSVPALFYYGGKYQSSYELNKLEKLSVYRGDFPTIPSSLQGLPFTKTDINGNYYLPVLDSTETQMLVLSDKNNNHRIDSGEIFNVLERIRPKPFPDTTHIHFLPTDIPRINPVAERTYFGYRIFGFKGYSHFPYNDINTIPSSLSLRPMVTVLDTLYLQTDSIDIIPFRTLYSPLINIEPRKKSIRYPASSQIIRNPGNNNLVHIAFSKPVRQTSEILLLAPADTLKFTPDLKSQAPFVLTINLPSATYNSISIPDSSVQFTDDSYFAKQLMSLPNPKDTVSVRFKRNNSDTAYYLIQVRSKTNSFYQSLETDSVTLRLPVDTYAFLIFHDQDRNGIITPASTTPLRKQEYHYTIPNYVLRKGIDTEETILKPR